MTRKKINYEELENKVYKLPTTSDEAMGEIVQGIYAGKPLLGVDGVLTKLVKDLTQLALQGEMEAHLAENQLEEGGNRRNGISKKMIKTAAGTFELESPRDRNGSFQPQLIKKRQTILNDELDSKILALYGLGVKL